MKYNKDFVKGMLVSALTIFLIAAATKQLIGPSTATVDNAVVLWDGTAAYKTKNSGVTVTTPATIVYGQSAPTIVSLGTITAGSTATLTSTNNQFTATFSGATATIALPASPGNGTWFVHGTTTYNSAQQIITVPSLIRPEYDFATAVTTFTNAASTGGYFTAAFTAIGGSFVKFSVVGDAYAP